jgi:hypothetical protein
MAVSTVAVSTMAVSTVAVSTVAVSTVAACARKDAWVPVPVTAVPITCDGEAREPAWRAAPRRVLVDETGGEAVPFSAVSFLRDGAFLYLQLYAGDEDIRSADDYFQLDFPAGSLSLRVDAAGRLSPPLAGARVGVDRDGTLDDPRDRDEEWVLEVALPLAAVAPPRRARGDNPGAGGRGGGAGGIPLRVSRCDLPLGGRRSCGHLATTLDLGREPAR